MRIMSSFIEEQGGYPDGLFIGTRSNTLDCSICLKVMRDAVKSCTNDHYNCRDCLQEHLRANRKECPECRVKIPRSKALESARILNTIISELPVKCCSRILGDESNGVSATKKARVAPPSKASSSTVDLSRFDSCNWTGQLNDLEAHVKVCQFIEVKCGFEECNMSMQRHSIHDHHAVCLHRLVKCDCCHLMVKFPKLSAHAKTCPKRPVPCPNKCTATIVFDQLSDHKSVCLLEVVSCQWKDLFGCAYRCVRRDKAAHTADASIHFTGMATKLSYLLEKLNKQSEQLAELKDENADLKEIVNDLEAKVENLEEECTQVSFAWEIQKFDTTKTSSYYSSEFWAFGHAFCFKFKKQNDGYYGLFLCMKSRVPVKLGVKATAGRYDAVVGAQHTATYDSKGLFEYPSSNDSWSWGWTKVASVADFTKVKLLTPEGELQIKAVVYKAMHMD